MAGKPTAAAASAASAAAALAKKPAITLKLNTKGGATAATPNITPPLGPRTTRRVIYKEEPGKNFLLTSLNVFQIHWWHLIFHPLGFQFSNFQLRSFLDPKPVEL